MAGPRVFPSLVNEVPLAHDRLPEASHFLQDDQGEEIARRLVSFYSDAGSEPVER